MFVAGGFDDNGELSSAELYDPFSGTWTATDSLNEARLRHTATLLRTGMVLVVAGGGNTAELYDPVSRTWSLTGSLHLWRFKHTATLLADGRVLVAGGHATRQGPTPPGRKCTTPGAGVGF